MGKVHSMKGIHSATSEVRALIGELSDDEVALVRALTPTEIGPATSEDHVSELVDVIAIVRGDEEMAEYLYAIAPSWDGSIQSLLLGARVSTAFTHFELAKAA
jgi:hypothetical protein